VIVLGVRPVAITHLRRRNPLRALLLPLAAGLFLAYFGYHAFNGAFGIWSMDRLKQQGAELSAQLADLKRQRTGLETKVARMRPESLDADLVDSSARSARNLTRADEVVLSPAAAR
jgi:cell division protein FtsB